MLDIDIDIVELELHTRTGFENELEIWKYFRNYVTYIEFWLYFSRVPTRQNGRRFRLCKDCGVHEARHTCTGNISDITGKISGYPPCDIGKFPGTRVLIRSLSKYPWFLFNDTIVFFLKCSANTISWRSIRDIASVYCTRDFTEMYREHFGRERSDCVAQR